MLGAGFFLSFGLESLIAGLWINADGLSRGFLCWPSYMGFVCLSSLIWRWASLFFADFKSLFSKNLAFQTGPGPPGPEVFSEW